MTRLRVPLGSIAPPIPPRSPRASSQRSRLGQRATRGLREDGGLQQDQRCFGAALQGRSGRGAGEPQSQTGPSPVPGTRGVVGGTTKRRNRIEQTTPENSRDARSD